MVYWPTEHVQMHKHKIPQTHSEQSDTQNITHTHSRMHPRMSKLKMSNPRMSLKCLIKRINLLMEINQRCKIALINKSEVLEPLQVLFLTLYLYISFHPLSSSCPGNTTSFQLPDSDLCYGLFFLKNLYQFVNIWV